jgi:hypothetical protein
MHHIYSNDAEIVHKCKNAKIFSLRVDTVPSLLLSNDSNNGFNLITVVSNKEHIYRITRQTTNTFGVVSLDKLDFSVSFGMSVPGVLKTFAIPYVPRLFTDILSEPKVVDIDAFNTSEADFFRGEIFKLLRPDIEGDDISREMPSSIDLTGEYSIEGSEKKIRFVYFTLLGGSPVYTSCFGNVPFGRDLGILFDPNKQINIIPREDTIYYVIRVSMTPNLIISPSVPRDIYPLKEIYTVDGITYELSASGDSLTDNSFYLLLRIPTGTDTSRGFNVEPSEFINSSTVTQISDTNFKITVTPTGKSLDMDMRVTVVR